MSTPLVFTSEELQLIANLRSHADSNIVPYETVLKMMAGDAKPIGDTREHVIRVSNYRIVYSIEDQGPTRGLVRHLSYTKKPPAAMTSDEAVEIGKLLGFSGKEQIFFTERSGFGHAVNLLEPMYKDKDGNELLREETPSQSV